MIRQESLFFIECDSCKRPLGYSIPIKNESPLELLEDAKLCRWHITKEKHLCPACWREKVEEAKHAE